MLGAYCTPAVDSKGRTYKRWHRTNQEYVNNQSVVTDLEDYSNAQELRKLTEKFIAMKVAMDLENFETKDKELFADLYTPL